MPNEDGVATAGPLSGMVVDPSAASTVESLTWSNISVELVGGGVGGLWIIVSVVLVASEDLAEISESFYPLTMALIGEEVEDIESILYIAREISVYKIPPLRVNEGHRANDWGDLASPLWKGRLRIIEKGKKAVLMFEDSQNGELFARAEYDPTRPSVEAVLDSSRYFVIRVEDKGKKAYIGMGFAERTDSFDFNVALQDYSKRYKSALNPPSPTTEAPSPHIPPGPKKDYSLKEGQTFSISIPGKKQSQRKELLEDGRNARSGGGIPLLPPPPSGRS